jgi:hypothetical protein
MRWREAFMTEVARVLHQLGMGECPVCGSARSLAMSPFPVVLADAGFPSAEDSLSGADCGGDLIFAVRVECATCGHLMLFNAQKYRTGDEKILVRELADEQEHQLGE